jgi:hypothetical protein
MTLFVRGSGARWRPLLGFNNIYGRKSLFARWTGVERASRGDLSIADSSAFATGIFDCLAKP